MPFIATFTPQAWVRDQVVEVDPEGETTWDASAAVAEHRPYFEELLGRPGAGHWDDGSLLDNDDVLKADPAAPAWVAAWTGPFDIHVRRTPDASDTTS